MLRHADIRVTQQFYADKKRSITSGLGSVLASSANTVPFAVESAALPKAPRTRRASA